METEGMKAGQRIRLRLKSGAGYSGVISGVHTTADSGLEYVVIENGTERRLIYGYAISGIVAR